MILGLSLHAFTTFHVALSLIGIVSGIVVVLGMFSSEPLPAVTFLFFVTTVLTSLTGFLFPYHGITPGIIVGILSILALIAAVLARYSFNFIGPWRAAYVVCSILALWFNVFVLIVQSFEKVPSLHALAPTQSEPPFKIAQLVVLIAFIAAGVFAVKKFHIVPSEA
jgi:hypothetical protein